MERKLRKVFLKAANRAKSFDIFGQPITLNVDGDETVTTFPGLVLTILVTMLLVAYGIKQVTVLVNKLDPTVFYYLNEGVYT